MTENSLNSFNKTELNNLQAIHSADDDVLFRKNSGRIIQTQTVHPLNVILYLNLDCKSKLIKYGSS